MGDENKFSYKNFVLARPQLYAMFTKKLKVIFLVNIYSLI